MEIREYDEILQIENIFIFNVSDIEMLMEMHKPSSDEYAITFRSGKQLFNISKENYLKIKEQYNLYNGIPF